MTFVICTIICKIEYRSMLTLKKDIQYILSALIAVDTPIILKSAHTIYVMIYSNLTTLAVGLICKIVSALAKLSKRRRNNEESCHLISITKEQINTFLQKLAHVYLDFTSSFRTDLTKRKMYSGFYSIVEVKIYSFTNPDCLVSWRCRIY